MSQIERIRDVFVKIEDDAIAIIDQAELLSHLLADPNAAAVMAGIRLIVLDICDRAIAIQGRLKDPSKLVRGPACAVGAALPEGEHVSRRA
jgi:hypothetical protein